MNLKLYHKKTSANIGFAKAGVKFPCVESFVIFIRKKPFRFFIFCNFEKTKMVFAQVRVYRKFYLSYPRLRKAVSR